MKSTGNRLRLGCLVCLALASSLPAASGTTRIGSVVTVQEHDRLIRMLEDSSLCDTCVYIDQQGFGQRVYTDSGRVCYQTQEPWLIRPGREWSPVMRLGIGRTCSGPLVFELLRPDGSTLLTALWREESGGHFEVFRSFRQPGVFPPSWSSPLNVTIDVRR